MVVQRKKLFIILVVIVILGALAGRICLYAVLQPRILGHIYTGNHISAEISIFLDGKELDLDSLEADCNFEGKACNVSVKDGTYKIKGGEYGMYRFRFSISEQVAGCQRIPDLELDFINSNSWYISASKVIVDLSTESDGKITGTADVTTIYNDGRVSHMFSELKESNEALALSWGL